jgi:hypothetical protein
MRTQQFTYVKTVFKSDVCPEVSTEHPHLGQVIQWADEHPAVWDIVSKKRSKAFGLGSCVYIGWAQNSTAPDAILERLRQFKDLLEGYSAYDEDDSIFTWRAQFTFKHYMDKDFRGGLFQQYDAHYPRSCLSMDYTPDTLELVLDKFCEWMDHTYDTRRITIDGKTVRIFKSGNEVCSYIAVAG